MSLNDILNNKLKLVPKSPKTDGAKKFISILKRNEYDPRNLYHRKLKSLALAAGLIDEQLNILQEE